MRTVLWILLGAAVAIVGWYLWTGRMHMDGGHMNGGHMNGAQMGIQSGGGTPILDDLRIPQFNEQELSGKAAFDANCATCHGENAAGVDSAGPPLVHKIYEPSHHGDGAFVVAARNGVRAHHWQFGNMPPVEGVTDEELIDIIAYVRKMQRANGIF